MKPDDEMCLCFHVTKRKVTQFIRVAKPGVASQLSECFGAGTGCGWCRPFLERIFESERTDKSSSSDAWPDLPDAIAYASSRAIYRKNRQAPKSDP